jgi:hypothetical protein
LRGGRGGPCFRLDGYRDHAQRRQIDRAIQDVHRSRAIGLEQARDGEAALVDHICFRVAGFHRPTATQALKKLGAEVISSNDEKLLRFKDLNGFVVELKSTV